MIFETGPETLFGVGRVVPHADGVQGSMPTGRPYLGPDGHASVGALGVLVDNALGYVIIDNLVGAKCSVSTEIWIDRLASLPIDGGRIRVDARSVHADELGGFSEGRVLDGSGQLLAACRARGRRIREDSGDLCPSRFDLPTSDAGDVVELLGLVPTGPEAMNMKVTPSFENPRGMLHGGVSLCAAEVVATRARQRQNRSLSTASVHIVHARPIPANSTVEFNATTTHAGRSLWVSDVTAWVDGKAACVTRVTAQPR